MWEELGGGEPGQLGESRRGEGSRFSGPCCLGSKNGDGTRDQGCPGVFPGRALRRVRQGAAQLALTVPFTPLGPEPLPPQGLQCLVLLSHAHSQACSLAPGLRGPEGRDGGLVWECSAGHTFSWGPSAGPTPPAEPTPALPPSAAQRSWRAEAGGGQEPAGRRERRAVESRKGKGCPSLELMTFGSKNDLFSMGKPCVRKYVLHKF